MTAVIWRAANDGGDSENRKVHCGASENREEFRGRLGRTVVRAVFSG
jgi:hypothetical protein